MASPCPGSAPPWRRGRTCVNTAGKEKVRHAGMTDGKERAKMCCCRQNLRSHSSSSFLRQMRVVHPTTDVRANAQPLN